MQFNLWWASLRSDLNHKIFVLNPLVASSEQIPLLPAKCNCEVKGRPEKDGILTLHFYPSYSQSQTSIQVNLGQSQPAAATIEAGNDNISAALEQIRLLKLLHKMHGLAKKLLIGCLIKLTSVLNPEVLEVGVNY